MKHLKATIGAVVIIGLSMYLLLNKLKKLPQKWHSPQTILYQAVPKIAGKHDLYISGFILSCPHGRVQELGLTFKSKKPYTIEEGRTIVVDAAHILLNEINSDPILKESLCQYPFPISRISIDLFVHNNDENQKLHKEIDVTSLEKNTIIYTTDLQKKQSKVILKETLDEAISILNKQANERLKN